MPLWITLTLALPTPASGNFTFLEASSLVIDSDANVMSNLYVSGITNLNGIIFPTTSGSANQVLVSDGTGNLSWANQTGGTGSDWTSSNGNTSLTGNLVLNGSANLAGLLSMTDGTTGQVIITDGSGNLSFSNSGGSLATVSESAGNTYLSGNLVVTGNTTLGNFIFPYGRFCQSSVVDRWPWKLDLGQPSSW